MLNDPKVAEDILRELLKEDEANAWALEELTKARANAQDWPEVFNLLIRRAELATDAAEQTSLRHEAARVAKDELKEERQAIELYRELLEAGGMGDEVAIRELAALYTAANRWEISPPSSDVAWKTHAPQETARVCASSSRRSNATSCAAGKRD